jgi:hypothetical protein
MPPLTATRSTLYAILQSFLYLMNRYLRVLLLGIVLTVSKAGFCSDSAYIRIRWNGEVDKPYHGFVFYKDRGFNPEAEDWIYNPFVLQCALTEPQFQALKALLFSKPQKPDSTDKSNPLFMSYYIGYFEGSNWVQATFLNSKSDFIRTYNETVQFFKGTEYESLVIQRWKMVFNRIGIKIE